MKATELIKQLEKIVEEHGDLDVEYADRMPRNTEHGNRTILSVIPFDSEGNQQDTMTHVCLI